MSAEKSVGYFAQENRFFFLLNWSSMMKILENGWSLYSEHLPTSNFIKTLYKSYAFLEKMPVIQDYNVGWFLQDVVIPRYTLH